jgi:hypothetical protein
MRSERSPHNPPAWLILSSDLDCTAKKMIGWNPTEYLFEYNLIRFNDTDS